MGRSPCCEKTHTNKGAWTKEEDERLIEYIRLHGEGCWRSLPQAAGLHRCGKSCRLRWINYLRPDLKRGNFTEDEDEIIIKLHSLLGNKWSLIAGRLPGRTDNEIKNYWNTHIKRKLISRGIDPQTHRPLNSSTTTSRTTPSTATAIPAPTPVTNTNIFVDFRHSIPSSSLIFNKNTTLTNQTICNNLIKLSSDSSLDTKCSSGTTEENLSQHHQLREHQNKPVLDLELSIGLPSSRGTTTTSSSSAESKISSEFLKLATPSPIAPVTPTASSIVAKAVCKCWQLGGVQNGQLCSYCKTIKGFHRYC